MRFQKTCYSCGAAAIVNALKCFGRNIPERKCRFLAGTTPEDGTEENGMLLAIDSLGYKSIIFSSEKKKESLSFLRRCIDDGMPIIIVSDRDTHWMTVVGRLGKRFLITDPARTVASVKENGIHVLGEKDLFARWTLGNEGHYGIAISTKKRIKKK